jgi:Ni,Fe-hydrogenase I large subunit
MRLDSAGRIADYRIVAPTEWNFHPQGPFVRLLTGANIGTGALARRRVERLAFVFDPCIAVGVEIRDPAHA